MYSSKLRVLGLFIIMVKQLIDIFIDKRTKNLEIYNDSPVPFFGIHI